MPIVWKSQASEFLISKEEDDFDVSFMNYSKTIDTALPEHPDLVAPVLHHIALGKNNLKTSWVNARESCLQYHPGWKSHLWTDENAGPFVEEHFPDLKKMWDNYKYPIQRIDALRYMVLYQYGGVVLDMDLKCTRSLGPLRRFGFVAPAAHPSGFSIGFMMASEKHSFVGQLVKNLPAYDRNWLGLPYPTVMFSTGCHYASAIHTLQLNRKDLKILTGTKENPKLHRLNGEVVTPLFHHLGSSSWHSFDAASIVLLGKPETQMWILFVGAIIAVVILVFKRRLRRAAYDPLDGPVLMKYGHTNRKNPCGCTCTISRMA